MVVYVHNISDAQSKDITNILQSCYHQICTREDTERQKSILALWKMVISLCLPLCSLFVAITSQKAQIIFLEQVSFTFFSRAGWILLRISLYTDEVIFNFANKINCQEPSYQNCMCSQRVWEKSHCGEENYLAYAVVEILSL